MVEALALALSLKKAYKKGENIKIKEARKMFGQSELINKLLETPKQNSNTFVGVRAY